MQDRSGTPSLSRRTILTAGATVGATAVAGCGGALAKRFSSTLLTGGSSTVFPIPETAAAYWGANLAPADPHWDPAAWDIETTARVADYWAGRYGYDPTDARGRPPFEVTVKLSHSGTGCAKLRNGQYDVGNSSAPVESELDLEDYSGFIDHVVGVDGQPLVVSDEIAAAGVEEISIDELRGIYSGEITNWSALGGPDKDILVFGRVKNSGTSSSFRANVFGDSSYETSVDQRYGQNQQLATALQNTDNGITYIALAFVEHDGLSPLALTVDGTRYEYGKNLGAKGYPLSRDLHMYTYEGTSTKEAAFLRMILSDFGQETFVKPANYFRLPPDRQRRQLDRLPTPTNAMDTTQ